MTLDLIKEEIELSLTIAKGSFFKRPEFGHRFKELRNVAGSETTRKKCEAYAVEALGWLVDYKHLRSVTAAANFIDNGKIQLNVECIAYNGKQINFKRFVEVGHGN